MALRTTMGSFEGLSDDTLAQVVSFLDFESVRSFTIETCPSLTERFASQNFQHVWRDIFLRHHFAIENIAMTLDYKEECKERRALVKNLVGIKASRHCFNVPNRFFFFVPITPDDSVLTLDDDPPPVDFDCNSFVLTSPGCLGEFLFLDPFDMSLSVYENCTENAVASDEAMMRRAMMNAAGAIHGQALGLQDIPEEHIAGDIIDETVYRNHNVEEYRTPPSQVLIDAQDHFNVDLAEYFSFTEDRHARRRTPQGGLLLHPEDEVDFGYMGIEAKPIVDSDGNINGTLVGLGRFLCSLHVDGAAQEENISCTEIVTWRKQKGQTFFADERICRVPWDIYCADTCSKHNRMYVVFYRGQGPLPRGPNDDIVDGPESAMGRKVVVAYPLVAASSKTSPTSPRYFPKPDFTVRCSDFVSYLTVDSTGKLLVGTNNGTIEVWNPETQTRITLLSSKEALSASAKRFRAEVEALAIKEEDDQESVEMLDPSQSTSCVTALQTQLVLTNEEGHGIDPDIAMEPESAVVVVENDQDIDVGILASSAVDSFHFPNHLPIEECGFISLQHSHASGTTLLLWKKLDCSSTDFQVVSRINLPLSSRRKPCVHFDGRRMIVLGEDHIGVIIMVYHVFSSTEDIDYFPSSDMPMKFGDESGGLYNFSIQPHVRFANRIRHAALGGLERYESLYMTCNERFIMVNTKTGNLLGGGSLAGEGLLVIDLQEHE